MMDLIKHWSSDVVDLQKIITMNSTNQKEIRVGKNQDRVRVDDETIILDMKTIDDLVMIDRGDQQTVQTAILLVAKNNG